MTFILDLISPFIASRITLLTFPSSFLAAELIKRHLGFVSKLSLRYFNVIKASVFAITSMRLPSPILLVISFNSSLILSMISSVPALIMHIGTNDLKSSSPSEISSSISSLGQEIRKEVPNTNLVISEVIIRNDDPSLNVKISKLNKNLAQVCANNNWDFITLKNILPVHLNSYGLHLNKQGSSYLAKNFINFLKSD